ncbi:MULTISPECIES: alpha/beta fold hydrolase [Streptomyces]|jgi:pimeloyl-ACP methyl ester carboxylesterase|uniref:Alpha/beta hydrolase n=1 Tax=Streptomyces spinosisporus TaxID=2927582 RepID=A0ABS9XPZ7_9ACTN|nr:MULTISPECIES: alpha/beta hydrolase [Streptomyces]MCI3244151.1 alpha/beta hydrolase [Streptomyces spinosisporus]WUB41004.1 alpha/beta hydrolase [Streptomyces sp. NBC_00588]
MPELRRIPVNGIELNVAVAGSGPAVLLLHGFPHTWQLWTEVMTGLSDRYRVIAPDLRGFGASTRARTGYDAATLAQDAAELLYALEVPSAAVVAIDAGTPPALLLALRRPELVRRLVVMEALVGQLPGAEDFLAGGPPWWFGFHAVPGLAETVLEGNEARYIDWFLHTGTLGDGLPPQVRDAFIHAYTGHEALRCTFSYYRALPESAAQISKAVATTRLTVPTLAVGAQPVGAALERQLRPITDDLTGHLIENCGHIIPLHRPAALLQLLRPFLAAHPTR